MFDNDEMTPTTKYSCADCKRHCCNSDQREHLPANCPLREPELYQNTVAEYCCEENHDFYFNSLRVEKEGFYQWPRLRETVEFAKYMGYRKLGLAFCIGLAAEAKVCADYLRGKGFILSSVICKNGGIDKRDLGLTLQQTVKESGFEGICNPIGQARLLARDETEFNIVLGLCVGHDSLFFQHSQAPVTVLAAKDKILCHNPIAALSPAAAKYLKNRL